MPESFTSRFKKVFTPFTQQYSPNVGYGRGPSSSRRQSRVRVTAKVEKSTVNSVYNRIAVDCSKLELTHVKTDKEGGMIDTVFDSLQTCLTLEANIDQTGRALVQDIVQSMFDEGVVAVVPTETDGSIYADDTFTVEALRTAKIVEWYPKDVKVSLYNDNTGEFQDVIVPKRSIAIIENPMYAIMNERNSTVQRLIRKLNLLDAIDEQSGAGKLDLIIQLPYVIKTDARKDQAEKRRKDIEMQLSGSKYGIAYTDGTEKITQLNRPVENNLMTQIEFLTNQMYAQLGITLEIMNGTADEKTMLNYLDRTIEPIMSAIALEFKRKFLSKTARTQGHSIEFFSDPFKLAPVSQIAEIADKFTRNEIMSANEIRQKVGLRPVDAVQADELRNKNLNAMAGQQYATTGGEQIEEMPSEDEAEIQNDLNNMPDDEPEDEMSERDNRVAEMLKRGIPK